LERFEPVFSELIAHLPHKEFQKCVTRYGGDHHGRSFSCWDHYLAMAFAQFTYRESLRDVEACLGSMQGKLYHGPLGVALSGGPDFDRRFRRIARLAGVRSGCAAWKMV
jgi:hypothetical protein